MPTTSLSRGGFAVTAAPEGTARFRRNSDGRFVNLDGSGPHAFSAVYKWAVRDKLAGRRRKSPPRAPVPAVDVDPAALRVPPGPGEPPRLVWLGHASWLIQIAGVSLLIDPVLGDSIVGFARRNGHAPLRAPMVAIAVTAGGCKNDCETQNGAVQRPLTALCAGGSTSDGYAGTSYTFDAQSGKLVGVYQWSDIPWGECRRSVTSTGRTC